MPETEKQIAGRIGEEAVCRFLKNKNWTIIDRNYRRSWGEIDVIARENGGEGMLVFVEVKTVVRDNLEQVSRETDNYEPEDNIHPWKLKRLSRVIQTYLFDKNIPDEADWRFDVAAVYLDRGLKLLKIDHLEDLELC